MAPRAPQSRKRSSEALSPSPSPSSPAPHSPSDTVHGDGVPDTADRENVAPLHHNIHLTPSKPPASKRPRWDDKNETKLKAAIAEIQVEVESRCNQLRQHAETLAFSLQCTFKTEMASLPRRVREMPMSTFCAQYASDVSRVLTEDVVGAQRELDTWIAQTPRLATSKKVQESVARTTRASARKQGLVVPPIVAVPTTSVVPQSSRATRANARTKTSVYETPSRAAAGKPGRAVARTRAHKGSDGDVSESDTEPVPVPVPVAVPSSGLISTLDTLSTQLTTQVSQVAPADKQLLTNKLKQMQEAMAAMMKQMQE